ncbi:uncharacterized protein LOC143022355 [Oratosquilla oratoria]|uniref:uncharacterized protein LOC143022355 n=1 Tax=Oratosquilla oratoria TaxID=337810 RepID=UPI003F75EF33
MVSPRVVLSRRSGCCVPHSSRHSTPNNLQLPPMDKLHCLSTTCRAQRSHDFNGRLKDEYSGNDFGHQESRDGYDTQGAYYVLQPDGRLRRVDYTVNGDSGFVAQVNYEGEARYPEPTYTTPRASYTTPRPAYTTPRPTYA